MNEKDTFERFRELVTEEQKKDQTAFLIWSSPEERERWGNDETKMMVEDAFLPHGKRADGKYYGEYKTMELDRAIRGSLTTGEFLTLQEKDGDGVVAMVFEIDNLLTIEGHLQFACRGMLYGHLNGPIIAYPSYRIVEFEVKK